MVLTKDLKSVLHENLQCSNDKLNGMIRDSESYSNDVKLSMKQITAKISDSFDSYVYLPYANMIELCKDDERKCGSA